MRRSLVVLVVLAAMLAHSNSSAQFKSQAEEKPNVAESMIRPESSSNFLGFFNPQNFMMHQSFSFSSMLFGGKSIGLAMYTNSMFYKVADPLDVRLDVSLMRSPFNSLGKDFQSDLNKIFINRAEVNYRPFDNMTIQLQYRQIPFSYYGDYYSPYYYNPFFH
jgi:hypothetical protein